MYGVSWIDIIVNPYFVRFLNKNKNDDLMNDYYIYTQVRYNGLTTFPNTLFMSIKLKKNSNVIFRIKNC